MARFKPRFCNVCGTELTVREQHEDGPQGWCPTCNEWRYPPFNTAVSVIVYHPDGDRILTIDQYGKEGILVAGYVLQGDGLEETVVREVREETGLAVTDVAFNTSRYFEPSNTLMCNFTCRATSAEGHLNPHEVDAARWIPADRILEAMRQGSLAKWFVEQHLARRGALAEAAF